MDIKVENGKDVEEILNYYGEEAQALKTVEELAELQRAIVRQDLGNMEEEIADVFIMLIQLTKFTGISTDRIASLIDYKIDRQLKRINAVG